MNDRQDHIDAEEMIAEAIDEAEEVHDPLDGLVERTTSNPGAPFEPDVLERLADLQKTDPASFENLRAQLKAAGCRVTTLDKALTGESSDTGRGDPKQADVLIALAAEADLFHVGDGTGYADVRVNGHRETWAIRSKGFKRWLVRRFYEHTGGAPSSDVMQSALNVIEAKAQFDGSERTVFIRVGGNEGKLYLDLCDENWRVVEIDGDGWRVIDDAVV